MHEDNIEPKVHCSPKVNQLKLIEVNCSCKVNQLKLIEVNCSRKVNQANCN